MAHASPTLLYSAKLKIALGFVFSANYVQVSPGFVPPWNNESSLAGPLVNTQGWSQGTPVLCARHTECRSAAVAKKSALPLL